jgi:hypothetical protein
VQATWVTQSTAARAGYFNVFSICGNGNWNGAACGFHSQTSGAGLGKQPAVRQ